MLTKINPYRTAIGPPFLRAATIVPPVEAQELGPISPMDIDTQSNIHT
jgi:hypothetical protein